MSICTSEATLPRFFGLPEEQGIWEYNSISWIANIDTLAATGYIEMHENYTEFPGILISLNESDEGTE